MIDEKLIRWKNKMLSKISSWRNSVVSKIKVEGDLDEIDFNGIKVKELKTKFFGRFRPSGFSRVLGVFKDRKCVGIILHYPTVWLKGENEPQRLNVNQKFEVLDSKGIFCEGTLGHPFPDLHAKYNVKSIIKCRDGKEFSIRFFPEDEAPVFSVGEQNFKAVFVVYQDENPIYFSPTVPLAGKVVYDINGNARLKFGVIGLLTKTIYNVLEGILKKYVILEKIDKNFPKCVALFLAQMAILKSYYIAPIEKIGPRSEIYPKY